MIAATFRDLWAEPAPEAPPRFRFDSAIAVLMMALGLADGLLSNDVAWPSITIPIFTLVPVVLLWRRSHPVPVAVAVSGAYLAVHAAMLLAGLSGTFLNAGLMATVVYTLSRWASGRDAITGLSAAFLAMIAAGSTGVMRELSGAIGLPVFMALIALVGVALRLWSSRNAARLGEAKMSERNRIARELHDTVAHHVSAIAIQAQGGQEIIETNPAATRDALAVIEEQASLILREMRLILGVLRHHEAGDLSPGASLGDIAGLADASGAGPRIEVTITGDLNSVSPSVGSTVFRLAQEAVTNSRRHARSATVVAVEVAGTGHSIELTVTDDGHSAHRANPGFGLMGMNERTTLLGGHCHAGPNASGGWTVRASVPKNGSST